MLNTEERITRLRSLGYAEREAAFLVSAALHSGLFVMRQFAGHAGLKPGAATDQFIAKATGLRHVRSFPTRNRTLIYQIRKPIFVAIGEQDNRNRRMKPPDIARLRLMSLDFVLAHPDRIFHATEEEKVAFFSSLAVAPALCPARTYQSTIGTPSATRRFIEKFPIYTRGAGAGFAFMCESSLQTFETFLDRHLPLMAALPEAEVVYVSTTNAMIEAARTAFARKTIGRHSIDFLSFEIEFRERAELEAIAPGELAMDKLRKLRRLRQSPAAPFYETWRREGLSGLQHKIDRPAVSNTVQGPCFTPCLLPEAYTFL